MSSTPVTHRLQRVRRSSAFTLIELLTVIAIIGILAAIIVPTVGSVKERAKTIKCSNRIRSWAVALSMCASDNKGRYYIYNASKSLVWCQIGNTTGGLYIPYFNLGLITDYELADPQDGKPYGLLTCPSSQGREEYSAARGTGANSPSYSSFAFARPHMNNVSIPDVSQRDTLVPLGSAKQPSRTLMVIERAYTPGGTAVDTGAYATIDKDKKSQIEAAYGSFTRHSGRINAAFMDGHVKALKWEDISVGSGRSAGFNTDMLKLD